MLEKNNVVRIASESMEKGVETGKNAERCRVNIENERLLLVREELKKHLLRKARLTVMKSIFIRAVGKMSRILFMSKNG